MKSSDIKILIKNNLYQICFNAFFLFLFFSGHEVFGDSIIRIIGIGFVTFFLINIGYVINYFKSVRALNAINEDDLNKSEHKKTTTAISILCSIIGLTILILWINKNAINVYERVWILVIVMLVSGLVFIIFDYIVRKSALKRKLERERTGQ
ncbi:MAG: hypothetical protein GY941_30920 [Planctomycetes bacterium]|nr:hypothetical protein [Planctomycetota bacterium]